MSIMIPPSLDWIAIPFAGQAWPQGDEDKMRQLRDAWYDYKSQADGISAEIASVAEAVVSNFTGAAADQFTQFINQLQQNVPAMSQAAEQLGQLADQVALNIETTKYMILAQMIWMAEQIIEWSATIWGLAVVPEIEAIGRSVIQAIARQLIESVIKSTLAVAGMDAAVQAIEMMKGDRTSWDWGQIGKAAEGGAIAGAISGLTHGLAGAISKPFTESLIGHISLGTIDGALSALATNAALGMNFNVGDAAAAGAFGGAFGKMISTGRGGDSTINVGNLSEKPFTGNFNFNMRPPGNDGGGDTTTLGNGRQGGAGGTPSPPGGSEPPAMITETGGTGASEGSGLPGLESGPARGTTATEAPEAPPADTASAAATEPPVETTGTSASGGSGLPGLESGPARGTTATEAPEAPPADTTPAAGTVRAPQSDGGAVGGGQRTEAAPAPATPEAPHEAAAAPATATPEVSHEAAAPATSSAPPPVESHSEGQAATEATPSAATETTPPASTAGAAQHAPESAAPAGGGERTEAAPAPEASQTDGASQPAPATVSHEESTPSSGTATATVTARPAEPAPDHDLTATPSVSQPAHGQLETPAPHAPASGTESPARPSGGQLTPQQHAAEATQYAIGKGMSPGDAEDFGADVAYAHATGNQQAVHDLYQGVDQAGAGSHNPGSTGSVAPGAGSAHPAVTKYLTDAGAPHAASMASDKFQEFATKAAENAGATPEEAADYGAAQAAAFAHDDANTLRDNSQQMFQTQRQRANENSATPAPSTPAPAAHTPATHTPEPQAGPAVTKYLNDVGAPHAANLTPDKFQEFATKAAENAGATPEEAASYGAQQAAAFAHDDANTLRDNSQQMFQTQRQRANENSEQPAADTPAPAASASHTPESDPSAPEPQAGPAVTKYLNDAGAPHAANLTPDKFQEFATEAATKAGATPEEAAQYGAHQAAAFAHDDATTLRDSSQQMYRTQQQRQDQFDANQLMQNLRTARNAAGSAAGPARTPAPHTPEPAPQARPAVTKYLTEAGAPHAASMSPGDFQEFATKAAENAGATPEEAAQYGAQQAAAFAHDDATTLRDNSRQMYRTQQQRQDQFDASQLMQNLRTARNSGGSASGAARTPGPKPQGRPASGKGGTSARGGGSRPRPSAGGNRGTDTNQPELARPGSGNSGRPAPPSVVAERTQERPSIIDQINRSVIDSIVKQVHDLPESDDPAATGGHDSGSEPAAGGHDSSSGPSTGGHDSSPEGSGGGHDSSAEPAEGGHDIPSDTGDHDGAPATDEAPAAAASHETPAAENTDNAPAAASHQAPPATNSHEVPPAANSQDSPPAANSQDNSGAINDGPIGGNDHLGSVGNSATSGAVANNAHGAPAAPEPPAPVVPASGQPIPAPASGHTPADTGTGSPITPPEPSQVVTPGQVPAPDVEQPQGQPTANGITPASGSDGDQAGPSNEPPAPGGDQAGEGAPQASSPTPAVPPVSSTPNGAVPRTVSSPRPPTPEPADDGQPAQDSSQQSAPDQNSASPHAPATPPAPVRPVRGDSPHAPATPAAPARPGRGDSPHAPATPPAPAHGDSPHAPATPPASSPTHSGGSPVPDAMSSSHSSSNPEVPGPPGSPESGRSMPRPATAEEFRTAIRGMLETSYVHENVPELRDWAGGANDALPYRTMIDQGNLWEQLNQREGPNATMAGGRAYVAAKSQSNIDAMAAELAHHAEQDGDDSWQEGVRQRLEQAVQNSVLRHYTPSSRTGQMLGGGDAGEMSSKLKLDQETAGGAEHNTGEFDLQDLANHGFVFFYIEPRNNPFRDSRFAAGDGVPTRITLPVDHVAGSGWIMLNDFYDMEFPTLRSDEQGNLLSYRRDQWDPWDQQYIQANSPEARMHQALVQHVDAIRQAWDDNPDLNNRAWELADHLAESFGDENQDADGAVTVGPEDTQSITGLLDIRQEIEQYIHDHGLDDQYAELQAQFARSVSNNVQVRRFDQDNELLGGQSRYVYGAPDADARSMNMTGGVDRYHEPLPSNILAGPHIATGLALRGALEIARINAAGGHDALVNRMQNMPGDQLLNLLLRSFMRPQAMIPWSVPITRDNLETQPSRPAAPAVPPAIHTDDQAAPAHEPAPAPAHEPAPTTGPRHGAEPREHRWFDMASGVEVHSSFDIRRVQHPDGTIETEIIRAVHVNVQPGVSPAQAAEDWRLALEGVETYLNAPLRELTNGQELIQVRLVHASDWGHAHEIVTLNPFVPREGHPDEPEHPMTQDYWLTGRHPMVYAHETAHGLGYRDESQSASRTHFLTTAHGDLRPITIERTATNQGSLLGDFHISSPDGLPQATLRPRHLQQLQVLIGDLPEPVPHDSIGHAPAPGGTFTLPSRTHGQSPHTPGEGEPPASSPAHSGGSPVPDAMSSSGHSSSNPEVPGPPGSPASGRSAQSQASPEEFMTAIRGMLETSFIGQHVPDLRNWAAGATDALPYRTMTDQGGLWEREGPDAAMAGGRAYVAGKSQSNVDAMTAELAHHAAHDEDYDGWQEQVRQRLEQAAQQSVLRHYTPSSRAEQMLGGGDAGEMKSKLKLDQETAGAAEHNTGEFDVQDLANHGFVFFYIEPHDTPFRDSRFAAGNGVPTRITVPIDRAAGNGWIMLNDFLDMEFLTQRSDAVGNLLSYRRDQWDPWDEEWIQANSPEARMHQAMAAIRQAWDDNPGLDTQAWFLAHQLSESFAEEHQDANGALTIGPEENEAINGLLNVRQEFEDYLRDHGLGDLYAQLQQQFARSVSNNIQVRRFDQDPDLMGGQSRYLHGTPGADTDSMNMTGSVDRYPEPLHGNILAGPHIATGLALRGTLEIARIDTAGGHGDLVDRLKNMPGDQLLATLLRNFMRPQAMLPWSVPITRDDLEYQPARTTAPTAPAAPPLTSQPRYGDSPHAPAVPAAPTLDRPSIEDQLRQDLIQSLLEQVHEHDELTEEAAPYPEFEGLDHIVLLDSGEHVYVDHENSQAYVYDQQADVLHPLPPDEAAYISGSVREPAEEPAATDGSTSQRPADAVLREHVWGDPASDAPVRSGFDGRRIDDGNGQPVTEITVGLELVPDHDVTPDEVAETWRLIHDGDEQVFNVPRHQLPDGSTLIVRTVPADRYGYAHQTVQLRRPGPGTAADAEAARGMTQKVWLIGRDPVVYAHEKSHQLGLRDESGQTSRDHSLRRTPGVPPTGADGPVTIERTADNHGSLLGDFTKAPPDAGLDQGGLRPRHLALLSVLIGDLTNAPKETSRPGDSDAATPATPRAPAAKDFSKELKSALDKYTDYRGGGLLGRVTKRGMRLRFARSKQLERSAQTLSHLSLLLHDSLRGLAQRSKQKDAANDREVQGMLINNRLLFATNFNSSIDLIRNFTDRDGRLLSLRTLLQQFHESDAGAGLSPAARAEYVGRLRRDYTKVMAAFDGMRGTAGDTTATTMRLGAGAPVLIADAGSSRMHEYLTDPRYRGAMIMLRYSALDPGSRKKSEKSLHAEQKLLLALRLSGIKPHEVVGPHIIMGKYRPCTACAGALAYYANRAGFGSLAFNPNYGHYYQDSTDGLVQYQSHVVRDPYYLDYMNRALSNMMSTPAKSEEQPPQNATWNNGPEIVIDPADASKRGYVTPSDSEAEVTTDPRTGTKTYTRSLRRYRYQYDASDSKGGIGKGSEQINAGRRRGGEISSDEIAKLRKQWNRGNDAERERLIRSLTTESTAPLTRPYLARVLDVSESKVNRYAKGSTGHKRSDPNAEVQRRGEARGPVTDEGRGNLLREMYRLDRAFYEKWYRWRPGDAELTAGSMSKELAGTIARFRELYNAKSLAHELHMSVPGLNNYLNRKYGLAGQRGLSAGSAAVKQEPADDVEMTGVGATAPAAAPSYSAAVYYPNIAGYEHIVDTAGQHYYRQGNQYYIYDLQTGVLHLFRQAQPAAYQHASGAGPSNLAAQHAYSEDMDVDEDSGSESDTESEEPESEEEYAGNGKQPAYRHRRWPQAPAAPPATRSAAATAPANGHSPQVPDGVRQEILGSLLEQVHEHDDDIPATDHDEWADLPDEPAGFAEVGPAQLSAGSHGQTLPVLSRGIAIGGVFFGHDGALMLDGQLRGPAETAEWIRQQPNYQSRPGPVVLIGGGAGAHPDGGEALAQFGKAVAADLGQGVIATPETVLQAPASEPEQQNGAEFHAGTAVIDDDGLPSLVSLGSDTWFIYRPDGSAHEAGPYLTTVLTRLGIGMDEPADHPPVPLQWNYDVPMPARNGLGTDVFPPAPLDTWLTAAAVVQRQGRYPLRIDTGPATAIERYQRDQEIAALAKDIDDGTVTVDHGTVQDPGDTAEHTDGDPGQAGPATGKGKGKAPAGLWPGLRGGGKKDDDPTSRLKPLMEQYTLAHGGGRHGRVTTSGMRLRFPRDKSDNRSAQTLSHLSLLLYDSLRGIAESHGVTMANDREAQGTLINGRLLFATNYNSSIDLIERTVGRNEELPSLRTILRQYHESNARRTGGMNSQDSAEYIVRLTRAYSKITAVFAGQRGLADDSTAVAVRDQAGQPVKIVDVADRRMHEYLTSPRYRGRVFMLRHSQLDPGRGRQKHEKSVHAEQKNLLAVHLSGLRPKEVQGEFVIMGKYRPCAGCYAALVYYGSRFGMLYFNPNYGHFYWDSVDSLTQYQPHVVTHPSFMVTMNRVAAGKMSTSALSQMRPPAYADYNNGHEITITSEEAYRRGYVTASDSDAETTDGEMGQQTYTSQQRQYGYSFGTGDGAARIGKGAQQAPRGVPNLNDDRIAELQRQFAQIRNLQEREAFVQKLTSPTQSAAPAKYADLQKITGYSEIKISRYARGVTGHETAGRSRPVQRREKAADLTQDGANHIANEMYRLAPRFYQEWNRWRPGDDDLRARDMSAEFARAIAALRSTYTAKSMASHLHMSVPGLTNFLNRNYGLTHASAADQTPKAEPVKQEPAEDVEMRDAAPAYPDFHGLQHIVDHGGQHLYMNPATRETFYWDQEAETLRPLAADIGAQAYAHASGAGPSGWQQADDPGEMELDEEPEPEQESSESEEEYQGTGKGRSTRYGYTQGETSGGGMGGSSVATAQYTASVAPAPPAPARQEYPGFQSFVDAEGFTRYRRLSDNVEFYHSAQFGWVEAPRSNPAAEEADDESDEAPSQRRPKHKSRQPVNAWVRKRKKK